MTKPKPAKPASPEVPPSPTPQSSEQQPQGGNEDKDGTTDASPPAEPMDTDKADAPPAAS